MTMANEMMKQPERSRDRRTFLKQAARLSVAAGAAALAPWHVDLFAQGPSAERRLVRSVKPQDLETPVGLFDSWITPNDLFYVRSHLYTPTISLADWTLTVDGLVDEPLKLTMDDLRKLPETTLVATLECAGNGRAFFDPPVAGIQWERGAVGNARWTGVRLSEVLKRAGSKAGAKFVWCDGADVPMGTVPDFIRNVPMMKAFEGDVLLAYAMNGAPLPVANGFPVRLVVPGWEAAYSVKWLTHLTVADREHDGFFVQGAYRYPNRRPVPGTTVDAKDMSPLGGMVVKSIITAPADGATHPRGVVVIRGFAWAGEAQITRVEVSTDNGSTWTDARLGTDESRWAWRGFQHYWDARETGSFVIHARAHDNQGRVQPITAVWNPNGYLWNAVDRVRVNIG